MAEGRVLVIDDDRDIRELLEAELTARGFLVSTEPVGNRVVELVRDREIDVVLTDVRLGTGDTPSGFDVSRWVSQGADEVPVVVMTAFGSLESAVEAIRAGAYDFVTKPIDADALAHTLGRAVEHRSLTREVRRLREAVRVLPGRHRIVHESTEMQRVLELVARVASRDSSVLILGESGTGKELVARAIHEASSRRSRPFVPVNCAAIPPTLLESELFGHVRGAFTDAYSDHMGLFARARGGTLFLDEIGEMPLVMQPKLLRVLEERRVRPVGGGSEIPIDVRLVSATHRDLEAEVKRGTFREDLFFRINVVRVRVPPLRERADDILPLAQAFLNELTSDGKSGIEGLSRAAARALVEYAWPGNVRELRNSIERAVALSRYDRIGIDDLPEVIRRRRHRARTAALTSDTLLPMAEVERRHIAHVLDAVSGNKARAAQILGFDRRTLYRKLKAMNDEA